MNFLLDTHAFLWFVNDNPNLSNHLKDLIEDDNNISCLIKSKVQNLPSIIVFRE